MYTQQHICTVLLVYIPKNPFRIAADYLGTAELSPKLRSYFAPQNKGVNEHWT